MFLVALLAPLALSERRRWLVAAAVGAAVTLAGASPSARADAAGARTDPASPVGARPEARTDELDKGLLETVRSMALDGAGRGEAPATAGARAPRIDVEVGRLDPRLRLAPCARIEPYLPAGVRLWGKSRIGLRCKEGPVAWNVYLPVTVRVWGKGLIVPAGAAGNSTLAAADLVEAEVDLAEEATPVVVDREAAAGRVLAQALKPGQALRQGHLKLRQFFAAGETVKLVATGPGYALESEGQALSPGLEGQTARVRIENGKVLTGTPVGERRVDVSM